MANIDRLVNVSIELGTTAIAGQSFSDLLILGKHSVATGRVMVVTDADQVLDLGIPTTDPIYAAVSAAFSQSSHISRVHIGKIKASEYSVIVPNADGKTFKVNLAWIDDKGEAQAGVAEHVFATSESASATELLNKIKALNAPVTASSAGETITIKPTGEADIAITVSKDLTLKATYTETVTEALSACARENNDWYGLAITSRVEDDVLQAAAYAEANQKLFGTASNSTAVINSAVDTDIASKLLQNSYFRSFAMYSHKADTQYPEVALMSYCFTFYPGAETWANKKLSGVAFSPLTETQYIAAKKKNVTTFERFNGSFSITQGGKVAGGEWIDIIRFRDWLKQEVQINVTSVLINTYGKVPYTDPGIELIGTAIRKALDLGVVRGGIAPVELNEDNKEIPSYVITLPRSSGISDNTKAQRVLEDVKFSARLAGAIHLANIKGNLAYSL